MSARPAVRPAITSNYEVRIEGAPVNPMPFVRSDQMAIAAITGKNVAMGGPE